MRTIVIIGIVSLVCLPGTAVLVLGSMGCGGSGTVGPRGCINEVVAVGAGGSTPMMFGIAIPPLDLGQTITISQRGRLVRLKVRGLGYLTGPGPLLLEVRRVLPNGLPDDTSGGLLGTVSVDVPDLPTVPDTVTFHLTPLEIIVSSGQTWAFVLRSNGAEFSIETSAEDNYAGGEAVQFVTSSGWSTLGGPDLGFELEVCVAQ